ncbi:hypothetical protein KKF91_19785, partial [Myxococcota bacterium]|nr:hypothetical protein [Myxococcota bacterium]
MSALLALLWLTSGCGEEDASVPLADLEVELKACLGPLQGGCRGGLHDVLAEGANACFVLQKSVGVDGGQAAESYKIALEYDKTTGAMTPLGDAVIPLEPGLEMEASLYFFGDGFTEASCLSGDWQVGGACVGPCVLRLDQGPTTVQRERGEDGQFTVFDFREGEECRSHQSEVPWNIEICDGEDNDCDGIIDEIEDLDPPLADKQQGVCAGSLKSCAGANGWVEPDYNTMDFYVEVEDYGNCTNTGTSQTSCCDGKDNDCDGLIDINPEGQSIQKVCYTGPPNTRNVGECRDGKNLCINGGMSDCNDITPSLIETCDVGDQNCNGIDDFEDEIPQTLEDENNCGQCGRVCAGGRLCRNGSCDCSSNLLSCDGECVDPNTDPRNCGRCGSQCGSLEFCVNGVCFDNCPES